LPAKQTPPITRATDFRKFFLDIFIYHSGNILRYGVKIIKRRGKIYAAEYFKTEKAPRGAFFQENTKDN
jgi:hypothetical protein